MALLAALLMPAGGARAEMPAELQSWFSGLSMAAPTPASIVICHGFTCHARTAVALTERDRATLKAMVRGANPEAERKGIAKALAWLDRRVGRETGTTGAKAYARGLVGDPTQFDCIDRTTNTASLFVVIQELGVLKHHTIAEPASRAFVPVVGRPHSTAVLAELRSGQKWAVDPWTRSHGQLPDVMPLARWLEMD